MFGFIFDLSGKMAQLETCWRLEDGGTQILFQRHEVEVQRHLTSLHHQTSRYPNITTSPQAIYQNLRIKVKITKTTQGRQRKDTNRREGEGSDRNRVSLFSLLFFPVFHCFNLYGFYKHDVFLFYYELNY